MVEIASFRPILLTQADGSERTIELQATPLFDEAGQVVEVVPRWRASPWPEMTWAVRTCTPCSGRGHDHAGDVAAGRRDGAAAELLAAIAKVLPADGPAAVTLTGEHSRPSFKTGRR